MSRIPMPGRTKVRYGGAIFSRAPRRYLFFDLFRVVKGPVTSRSTNLPHWGDRSQSFPRKLLPRCAASLRAGGEDLGYFATMENAGSNPAFDCTYRGGGLARPSCRGLRFERTCVALTGADFASSPACFFRLSFQNCPVVKSPVTSLRWMTAVRVRPGESL